MELDADGRAYFGGNSFDLELFAPIASFYDDTGTFLGSHFGTFAGMAYVDGEVIAAVQGFDEGMLVRLSDGAVLTTTDLLGAPALFGSDTAIFSTEGGLGLLLWDDGDYFVSLHDTFADDAPPSLPERVSFHVDSTDDGIFDLIFTDTDFESFSLLFQSPGHYPITVHALDEHNNILASVSETLTVAPFRIESHDGEDVLRIVADLAHGSTILVHALGQRLRASVDGWQQLFDADRIDIRGSDQADRITLVGPFHAEVQLGAGNDQIIALRLRELRVDLGSGQNVARFFHVGQLDVFGGDDGDEIRSFFHDRALIVGGSGRNSIFTIGGKASFIIAGAGRDQLRLMDERVAVVTGTVASLTPALVEEVFDRLEQGRAGRAGLEEFLWGVAVDDGDSDDLFLMSRRRGESVFIAGPNDRVRARV